MHQRPGLWVRHVKLDRGERLPIAWPNASACRGICGLAGSPCAAKESNLTICLMNPSQACFPDWLGKLAVMRGQWALILRPGWSADRVPVSSSPRWMVTVSEIR